LPLRNKCIFYRNGGISEGIRAGAASRVADSRFALLPGSGLERRMAVQHATIGTLVVRNEPNVYRRTLARAIEIAGGEEVLARFLACTPSEIAKWTSGESAPPMPIFLAMVDIAAANALTATALENLPAARARRSTWIPAPDSR
jgi:hypothetical protein